MRRVGSASRSAPDDRGAAGLARSVGAVAQALQRPVDPVEDGGGPGQLGLVALLHERQGSARTRARRGCVQVAPGRNPFRGCGPGADLPQPVCRAPRSQGASPRPPRVPTPAPTSGRLRPRAASRPPRPRSARPAASCSTGCPTGSRRRCRRAGAHALGAGHQRRAPCGHRVRGDGARRRRTRAASASRSATPPAATRPRRSQAGDAPHGRGLHIVRTLADAWGIEMQRDRPGKTVWFSSTVAGRGRPAGRCRRRRHRRPETVGPATRRPPRRARTAPAGCRAAAATDGRSSRPGPLPAVRAVLDGLRDAVVATDEQGSHPLRQRHGRGAHGLAPRLPRRPVGPRPGARRADGAVRGGLRELRAIPGRRPRRTAPRRRSSSAPTGRRSRPSWSSACSTIPSAGRVVVGIFRSRDDRRLQRWSELTSELLEILADAPIDDPPAERLLSTLGRRLDWDVTTLWALSANQELVCRHVWTRTPVIAPAFAREKAVDPTSGSEGLPRWVVEHGEPIWVPDLMRDRALHDRRTGQGRAAERLRLPHPLPGRVCRGRQDAEPPAARARPLGGGADGRRRRPSRRAAARVRAGRRARAAGRRAPRGAAPQRVPAPGDPGALRGRRLPRDGRAPGPGLGPRDGGPVPHRHRGRGRADAAHGRLARRPEQADPHRGAPDPVPARPGGHAPDHEGHADRPLHVELVHGRRVPAVDQPGRPALRHPQDARASPRT